MSMEDDQQNYFVYMHINKINGKKYIGITCQKPEYRWGKKGNKYKNNIHFYAAIQKYGWDNFEHIIYQSRLTKGQACGLEQQLILLFETNNPDKGYNFSGGGESGGYIDGRSSDPDYHKNYLKNMSAEKKKAKSKRCAQRRRERLSEMSSEEKRKFLNEDNLKQKERRNKKLESMSEEERKTFYKNRYQKVKERMSTLSSEELREIKDKRNEHLKQKRMTRTPEEIIKDSEKQKEYKKRRKL